MMPRVAKRINNEIEKQNVKSQSKASMSEAKKQKSVKSTGNEKPMSYEDIQYWHREYSLPGKVVYQLDAEFTSLVKIQVQELQKEINKIQKNLFNTSEKEAESAKAEMYKL